MRLKVPPALQFVFFALLIWLVDRWFPEKHLQFSHQNLVSWFIFIAGALIGIWAVLSFKKARTTVDPTRPEKATALVIVGCYRFSRNPMYLAMLLVLLAYTIRLGNAYTLLLPAAYVLYITEFQIKPEETALSALFGEAYHLYKKKVRRWI